MCIFCWVLFGHYLNPSCGMKKNIYTKTATMWCSSLKLLAYFQESFQRDKKGHCNGGKTQLSQNNGGPIWAESGPSFDS